jgi:hypothetical protein
MHEKFTAVAAIFASSGRTPLALSKGAGFGALKKK